MAITGGYIGLFHSARLLILNFTLAMAIAIVATTRVANETDIMTAAEAFSLIWLLNVAVPLEIRGTSRAMGEYAIRSDEDPLTGLLNRRGFIDAIHGRLADPLPTATHLTVLMVDLDNFKLVNDTHGHAAGDRMLRGRGPVVAATHPPGRGHLPRRR
ncbi:GGDEF domain-containing protein [Mycobacterium sp. URHB0021]